MSYHIEDARGSFNELPERILMREDGHLGAYKFHGKPIVDYWYVPMERAERLESENAKLRELVKEALMANNGGTFWEYFDPYSFWAGWCKDAREMGIEVDS